MLLTAAFCSSECLLGENLNEFDHSTLCHLCLIQPCMITAAPWSVTLLHVMLVLLGTI